MLCMPTEMKQISEQVRLGEVNYTPEKIYAMVVDPLCTSIKRARKSKIATHFSLYEKNEHKWLLSKNNWTLKRRNLQSKTKKS